MDDHVENNLAQGIQRVLPPLSIANSFSDDYFLIDVFLYAPSRTKSCLSRKVSGSSVMFNLSSWFMVSITNIHTSSFGIGKSYQCLNDFRLKRLFKLYRFGFVVGDDEGHVY